MIDTYEYIKTKMWSIIHVLNYIFTVYECNCLIVKIFFILLKTSLYPKTFYGFIVQCIQNVLLENKHVYIQKTSTAYHLMKMSIMQRMYFVLY